MPKFAAYKEDAWTFDLRADDEQKALELAKQFDPEITRVEMISEIDSPHAKF